MFFIEANDGCECAITIWKIWPFVHTQTAIYVTENRALGKGFQKLHFSADMSTG